MSFQIYFVSMTRLSLQIKSKLIFLTATWVHPAGVGRASCASWMAVPETGMKMLAGGQRCSREKTADKQVPAQLYQGRGSKSKEVNFIFWKEKRQTGPTWPQRLSGRNTREQVWAHDTEAPSHWSVQWWKELAGGVARSLSQQVSSKALDGLSVSGDCRSHS